MIAIHSKICYNERQASNNLPLTRHPEIKSAPACDRLAQLAHTTMGGPYLAAEILL